MAQLYLGNQLLLDSSKLEGSNIVFEDIVDESTTPNIDSVTREELKQDLFSDQWTAWGGIVNREEVSTTTTADNILVEMNQNVSFEVASVEYFKIGDIIKIYVDTATIIQAKVVRFEKENNYLDVLPLNATGNIYEVPAGSRIVTEGGDIRSYSKFDVAMDYDKAVRIYGMHEFIDKWNEACKSLNNYSTIFGKFNAETEYFELNTITDITYSEALLIYKLKQESSITSIDNDSIRTNLHIANNLISFDKNPNCDNLFRGSNFKIIRIAQDELHYGLKPSSVTNMFFRLPKCHTILGILNLCCIKDARLLFASSHGAPSLVNFTFKQLRANLNLGKSPLVSLASMQYLITNADNTTAITITVHPDVYAKLTDTSNSEWNKVVTDAAAKQITFATV